MMLDCPIKENPVAANQPIKNCNSDDKNKNDRPERNSNQVFVKPDEHNIYESKKRTYQKTKKSKDTKNSKIRESNKNIFSIFLIIAHRLTASDEPYFPDQIKNKGNKTQSYDNSKYEIKDHKFNITKYSM